MIAERNETSDLDPCRPWQTPFGVLLRRAMLQVLRVLIYMTCCAAAARWGASAALRDAPERAQAAPLRGRGELWLRCPGSSTWHNYGGGHRDLRVAEDL